MFDTVEFNQEITPKKEHTNKKPMFQKKIIKDENIGDFFTYISKLEEAIFNSVNYHVERNFSFAEFQSTKAMIKICNSLLDIKKKQLEIRRITNYSKNSKDIKIEEFE